MTHRTILYLQIIHGKQWHRWRRKPKHKVIFYNHAIDKLQMLQVKIVPWINNEDKAVWR